MIRRPPRSTQSRSSAASDVYKRQCPHVALWELVMGLPDWSDWFLLQGLSDTPRLTGRLPLLDLHRQLAPSSLQGLLASQHYSPWNTPAGTADRLLPLLRRLLHSVLHDPCVPELPAITLTILAHGLPGVVIRSDSDTPGPVPPLPLSLSVPRPTGMSPNPAVPSTMSAEPSSAPAPIPHPTS